MAGASYLHIIQRQKAAKHFLGPIAGAQVAECKADVEPAKMLGRYIHCKADIYPANLLFMLQGYCLP